MLLKEYRILLPLTVEEYGIAQLYMIQKKSRLDSSGAGSGVEIIKNEPYTSGPGGRGQYTYKVYHIGDKMPAWVRSFLPTLALEAVEEAWNAYPQTRTSYSSQMLDRLKVDVETVYRNDAGVEDNVFGLTKDELKQRQVDVMDFVNDPISSGDYVREEDPREFCSRKTGRGPLSTQWRVEYAREGRPIMCAYKLCRVEFKYWGLQQRVERWIHDLALRNTMLRAHRQAWAWQDEWVGLTLDDVRRLEAEAAVYLQHVMKADEADGTTDASGSQLPTAQATTTDTDEEEERAGASSSSDIFFDCVDAFNVSPVRSQKPSLIRWSSELLVNDASGPDAAARIDESPPPTPRRLNKSSLLILVFHGDAQCELNSDFKSSHCNTHTLRATLDALIDTHYEQLRDCVHVLRVSCGDELRSTMASLSAVASTSTVYYPSLALILASSPRFYEAVQSAIVAANRAIDEWRASAAGADFAGEIFTVGDCIGGLLMFEALMRQNTTAATTRHTSDANRRRQQISRHSSSVSTQSRKLSAQIAENAEAEDDDWLPKSVGERRASTCDTDESTNAATTPARIGTPSCPRHVSAPPSSSQSTPKRMSTHSVDVAEVSTNAASLPPPRKLTFRPRVAFNLGCPLALVLMQRRMQGREAERLECDQLFNLYYSLDACGARLEPVLNAQLAQLPALQVPRYQRFPLGDGGNMAFGEALDSLTLWGNRRVDHQLYCPPEMASLPALALPNILHASYWESKDVAAFLLRQFVRREEEVPAHAVYCTPATSDLSADDGAAAAPLGLDVPAARWTRRRTRFKVVNLAANHRANDVLVVEGEEPRVHARFCYGPMDVVALSREEVLVYVRAASGKWHQHDARATTDAHGRIAVNLSRHLAIGVHAVKLIVAGDHSYINLFVAVVPRATRCALFSVDGSLTASVSVTGRDPRVRPGAVDLVRYWQQQQGCVIVYVSARPDWQQRVVGSWLAQHNFPHGLLFFTPSISTDPFRHKTQLVRRLVEMGIRVQVAYGSNKDVPVYASAGVDAAHIFTVGGRRRGCVALEEGYTPHLHELHAGRVAVSKPLDDAPADGRLVTAPTTYDGRNYVQRAHSFTPRTGKYDTQTRPTKKKISQISLAR